MFGKIPVSPHNFLYPQLMGLVQLYIEMFSKEIERYKCNPRESKAKSTKVAYSLPTMCSFQKNNTCYSYIN